ncbi:MAG: polyhydroxyalkanoate synthesis regulator DNA-binding domain-containing protein [Steroidobacteraceae bacterium]
MSEPRLIKKYPNRRLYDTELSRYITIEDVRALINTRTRPRIIEQRSGADITRSVLLQVVAELELGDSGRLSEDFLTGLIRSYELTPAAAAATALESCITRQLEPSGIP